MKVRFSCVVDQHPKFGRQAFVWAASLLTYGGVDTDSLVIHTVGDYGGEYRRVFDDWGIEVRVVPPFDSRHPNSNKLAQLESEALHAADYAVLCDCDTSFCQDISSGIRGMSIRARIGSYTGLPPHLWERLFRTAGLDLPAGRIRALLNGQETLPGYCNGGIYIIPQPLFQRLGEVWPRWDRWLLDRESLIKPFGAFADQISFAMSCAEMGISIDYLPLELNFYGISRAQTLYRVSGRTEIHPLVLHYHQLDEQGLLHLTQIRSVNRQIRKINDLIRLAEQVNFDKASLMLLRETRVA
jgi:hypothetical protein